jgi:hypothetical protein
MLKSKLFRNIWNRHSLSTKKPYEPHIQFCKLSIVMVFSMFHSVLLDCILRVVFWCSKKQMLGIYARSIVAAMANEQRIRRKTVVQPERETMSQHSPTIDADEPIPFLLSLSRPDPASVSFLNLSPKPSSRVVSAGVGAEVDFLDVKFLAVEFRPACGTDYKWHSKPFLSDVKRAIGYRRWPSPIVTPNPLFANG